MKVLRGITWKNKRGYEPLVHGAELWMKDNPDIKVIWDQLPWYKFEEKILSGLADGTNEYDLIMFDHPWTGRLQTESWLNDLSEVYNQEYLGDVKARCVGLSYDSYSLMGQWAIPLDAACHIALYRDDILEADELPKTWDDVIVWSKDYLKTHGKPGLVMSVEGVLGSCLFLSMMAGLGYSPYLNEKDPVCNRKAAKEVLEYIKQLLEYTPKGSEQWGPWDIYENMAHDKGGVYSPSIFGYVNYINEKPFGRNLKYGLVPAFEKKQSARSILGGVGIGIARASDNIEEAASLIKFYASDYVQKEVFVANYGQPAVKAVWDDDHINTEYNNMYRDMMRNMNNAYIRPRYERFHELELYNGECMQKFWNGEATIKETLDKVRAVE